VRFCECGNETHGDKPSGFDQLSNYQHFCTVSQSTVSQKIKIFAAELIILYKGEV
jgi:hypothetical protein